MSLPLTDWQFWVVTAAVAVALAWLLRGVVPVPGLSKRRRKRERRVTLTVEGKKPA
jgi:hypothetical protein